jgi:hypothetical protein
MPLNRSPYYLLAISSLYVITSGCAQQGYTVIAATNTTIGVGISQQPTNGGVDATLGYKRQELAFIPTNRLDKSDQPSAGGTESHGAKDTGNVIMEIRQSGIFSFDKDAGIYQRLAVGDIAVHEPGATLMFAKGNDGELDAATQQAIINISKLPSDPPDTRNLKSILRNKYQACKANADTACTKKMDAAAQKAGAKRLSDLYDKRLTDEQIAILKDLI